MNSLVLQYEHHIGQGKLLDVRRFVNSLKGNVLGGGAKKVRRGHGEPDFPSPTPSTPKNTDRLDKRAVELTKKLIHTEYQIAELNSKLENRPSIHSDLEPDPYQRSQEELEFMKLQRENLHRIKKGIQFTLDKIKKHRS